MLNWIKSLFVQRKDDNNLREKPSQTNTPKSFHVDRMGIETKEENNLPDFSSMTKLEIDIWARDQLDLKLDRRRTKEHMVETIKNHLKEDD